MTEPRNVILDCDTGSDDAVAIMLAVLSPKIHLLGVTTVAGNKGVDLTTENTLAVLDALGSSVPVFRGCGSPMVTELHPGRRGTYNGMTGIATDKVDDQGRTIVYHTDRLPLPAHHSSAQKEHAVFWLIRTLLESQGDITLVPTGPLTNIAMAMRLEPRICEKIQEIVFMGGGVHMTNATCAAEFNIWRDPEAAQIVLTSGVKITMVPLDATHQANFTYDHCARLRQMNSVITNCVAEILEMRIQAYDAYQPQALAHSAPLHDALALAYVIDPQVLQDLQFCRVDVDISGGFADGQTICDPRTYPDRPKNCTVALAADRQRFADLTFRLLAKTTGAKTLLFDLDGTLTDSGPGIIRCAGLALKHFGLPVPDDKTMGTFVGPPLRDTFQKFGVRPEDVEEAVAVYRLHYNADVGGGKFENRPYDGIEELLKTLKARGHRLLVATSKPEHLAVEVLEHFGLAQYFDTIRGAHREKGRDSKAQVIQALLEDLDPETQIIMVGDTAFDVLGAKAHNIPTAAVTWGYGQQEDLINAGAAWLLHRPEDLLELLKTL